LRPCTSPLPSSYDLATFFWLCSPILEPFQWPFRNPWKSLVLFCSTLTNFIPVRARLSRFRVFSLLVFSSFFLTCLKLFPDQFKIKIGLSESPFPHPVRSCFLLPSIRRWPMLHSFGAGLLRAVDEVSFFFLTSHGFHPPSNRTDISTWHAPPVNHREDFGNCIFFSLKSAVPSRYGFLS